MHVLHIGHELLDRLLGRVVLGLLVRFVGATLIGRCALYVLVLLDGTGLTLGERRRSRCDDGDDCEDDLGDLAVLHGLVRSAGARPAHKSSKQMLTSPNVDRGSAGSAEKLCRACAFGRASSR